MCNRIKGHYLSGQEGVGINMKQFTIKTAAIIGCLTLAACAPQLRNHGYVPSVEDISYLIVGVDTRGFISESLGAPSQISPVGDSAAYYIRSKVRYFTLTAPKEMSREVVVLRFDRNDVLTRVEQYTLKDGRIVSLDPNYTKLAGNELTALQRMLRSIGGMNAQTLFSGGE